MKILFIGMGSIGGRHYNCLRKYKQKYSLEFISYKTNLNKANKQYAEDIKYFYCLEDALLEKPNCAIISNPTSYHVETAIKCAEKGIHLFIEKPLSNTLENIDKLINLVKDKKLITLMGCNLRYHDALIDLRNLIQTNKLGRVYDFDISVGSYLPDWRPWQDYTQSYSAKEELGGGVVLDLIHEIDYAYWLFGEFTKSKSFVGKISDLKINTEDIAKIILQTANQCMGTISLNYYRRIPERKIAANFEYGSILLDLIKSQFTIYYADDHCEVKNYQIDRNHMYERQMKYFIESVIHKKETQNNILEGLKVLEYALNIKQGKDII